MDPYAMEDDDDFESPYDYESFEDIDEFSEQLKTGHRTWTKAAKHGLIIIVIVGAVCFTLGFAIGYFYFKRKNNKVHQGATI